jgi:hypothetical protein
MDGLDDIIPDAQVRIEQVEKRLNALQELGQDTAALRSQLAFARTRLAEGASDDALRICDEVLITARRQANSSGEQRVRTVKITRDELGQELQAMLSRGLFARLLAEHQPEPSPKLEARLEAFDQHIRDYLRASHHGLAETCATLRADLDHAVADLRSALAGVAEHATGAERTQDAEYRSEEMTDDTADASAGSSVRGADVAALAAALTDLAERLDHRLAAVQEEQVRAGAAWRDTVQAVVAEPLTGLCSATERLAEPKEVPELTRLDATVRDGLEGLRMATERLAESRDVPALTNLDAAVRDGLAGVRDAVQAAALDQDALLTAVRGLASGATTPAAGSPGRITIDAADLDRLIASLEQSQMALIEGLAAGFARLTEVLERRPAPAPAAVDVEHIRNLVREELGNRLGDGTVPRLVSEAVTDPLTAHRILGMIALEAVSHPGVLGELTGLRAFLRRELRIAVEAYAKDALPV